MRPWVPRILAPLVPREITRSLQRSRRDVSRLRATEGDPLRDAPGEDFAFFLRTFGNDGRIKVGDASEGRGYPQRTLEALIAEIAASFGLKTLAFHDRRARRVPEAVDYYLTDHDDWVEHFEYRATRASVIVVIGSGRRKLGSSFREELLTLGEAGLGDRVVLVSPPGLGAAVHRNKDQIFDALDWPPPGASPLVAYRRPDGKVAVQLSLGRNDVDLESRYGVALEEAFAAKLTQR